MGGCWYIFSPYPELHYSWLNLYPKLKENMKKKIKGSNDKTEVQIAELKKKIKKQKQQYETCANDYESQVVINKLLSVSVQNVSLDMMMGLFIGHIASIPWFELEAKGAIFLVEESGELSMKANYNLSPVLANMCDKVPFGRCLCGRAAIDKKIIFSTNVDERHENKYKGMKDHGHYCVPIVSASNDLLGVLTLYVGEGHKEKEKEKKFLRSVASLIANVIEQRRSVDRLVQAEKMVTMGQMAAGIIHDTNNAVGVVMGAVQFLLQGKKKFDPRTKNFLKIIERQTKRIKKINERLLWYARKRTVHHEAVDINELLKTIPSVLTFLPNVDWIDNSLCAHVSDDWP